MSATAATRHAGPGFTILGAGSLGLLWATQLSECYPVSLIGRSPLAENIKTYPSTLTIKVQFPADLNSAQPQSPVYALPYYTTHSLTALTDESTRFNTVLICTKSFDAENAARTILPYLSANGTLILLQNGMGFHEDIAELLAHTRPDIHLYAMSTTEGANRPAHDSLVYAGKGTSWIGPVNEASDRNNRATEFADLFGRASMVVQAESHIEVRLWQKLVINCGINPFTAILNCPNGDILSSPYFETRIHALAEELSAVSTHYFREHGLPKTLWEKPFDARAIEASIRAVATKTATNISSMLQDQRKGKRTEIDDMNGFVCRYAAQHDIATPRCDELTQAVKGNALTP